MVPGVIEIINEEPTGGVRKRSAAEAEAKTLKNGKLVSASKISRRPMFSTALRVASNSISTLNDLPVALEGVMHEPSALNWIDASFNALDTIEPILLEYKSLNAIYLHANNITDIHQVDKLAEIPNLRSLTLHGNPVEEFCPFYRNYILSALPTLKSLDFSSITNLDRDKAMTWRKVHYPSLVKRKTKV